MTVLAELPRGLVSLQCDLCVPPVLTINTPADLRRTGWLLRSDGQPWDVCPSCALRTTARDRVPRRDAAPVEPDPALMPNLVVVGATKAGTTSMHNYLGLHPDITVSRDKEARFFQDPACRDWLGLYQANFVPGTRYRAESTPFYSKSPCFPGVVDRLAELAPDARLLYLVRDPLERIVAEYVEQMQWGAASRPLDVELSDAEDPRNWLVASSRYATQLKELRRRFDADRVLVVDLADLAADTPAVMGEIFGFLGLPPLALAEADFGRFNARDDKRAYPDWLQALRSGPAGRAAHRLPDRPRAAVSRMVGRLRGRVEAPRLSDAQVTRLEHVLRPEVDELRTLTGRPFGTWSL